MSSSDHPVYDDDPDKHGFVERVRAEAEQWGAEDELVGAICLHMRARGPANATLEAALPRLPAELLAAIDEFVTGDLRHSASRGIWWLLARASARSLTEQAPSPERVEEAAHLFRRAPYGAHGALLDEAAALLKSRDDVERHGWAEVLGAPLRFVRAEPDSTATFTEYRPAPETSISDPFKVWSEHRVPIEGMLGRCALQLLHRLGLEPWLERIEAWDEPLLVTAELHARLLAPRWEQLRLCLARAKPVFSRRGGWQKPLVGAVALAWLPVRYAENEARDRHDGKAALGNELRQTWDVLLDRSDGMVIAGALLVELARRTARGSYERGAGMVLARETLAERMVAKGFSASRMAKEWATAHRAGSDRVAGARSQPTSAVYVAVLVLVIHGARVDLELAAHLIEMIAHPDPSWRSHHEAGRLEPLLQGLVDLTQRLGDADVVSLIERVERRYVDLDRARLRGWGYEDDAAFASVRLLWVLAAVERARSSVDADGARLSAWVSWTIRLVATSWDGNDARSRARAGLLGLLLVRAQSRCHDAFERGLRYAEADPALFAVVLSLLVEELGVEGAEHALAPFGRTLEDARVASAAWAAATNNPADQVAAQQVTAALSAASASQ